MEAVNRLNYQSGEVTDSETDVSLVVKQSLATGLNDGGVLSFRFPADPERFTDLNTIMLRLTVSITLPDGSYPNFVPVPPLVQQHQEAWLDPEGMHSLFSTVEVRFNDEVVSTMNMYPFTTALARRLGTSKSLRDAVWDELDGTYTHTELRSSFLGSNIGPLQMSYWNRISREKTLYGRIYSDILTSGRQYLPPGVTLGINLRRAPDRFSLVSNTAVHDYRLSISSASVYIKRLQLRPSLVPKTIDRRITFNRLDAKMMAIPQGSSVFRWLNCLNNGPLPNRLYVGFVAQESVYGNLARISTFFECLNMRSLNFKLNGRDLLVEPIRTHYVRDANGRISPANSDARQGYLSLIEVWNQISDQLSPVRLSYTNYYRGVLIYAIELSKCGEKTLGGGGALDVEVEFNNNLTDLPACMILFTEKTETARF